MHGDGVCRVLTLLDGAVILEYDGEPFHMRRGDTMLLPASIGCVEIRPEGDETANILDAHLP